MAISLRAAGSWAYASSGSVTPTLPTHASGDMLLVRVAYKSSNLAACTASTATTGWSKLGQFTGTGNSGNGTGGVSLAVFYKEAASASETAPQVDFSQTVTQVGHVALSYQKGASESWLTPEGAGGEDTTADTSKSMTMASHVSTTAGDMVDFFLGIRDDCTVTSPTFTQTGVTFGTVSEQPATAGTDTSGADGAYDGGYRLASSGTSSAAAVVTATLNTSETGSAWTTRLRVFTPETHSGSLTATGGGVGSTSGQKGAQLAATATGGGVDTSVAAKGGQVSVTGTGAGVQAAAATSDRSATLTATGGGVYTHDYEFESGEEHDGSVVATGSGAADVVSATDRPAPVTATGAGAATAGVVAGRATALTATGGGSAAAQAETARQLAAHLSGGGVLTAAQVTARSLALTATGGGVAEAAWTGAHAGSLAATGGGTAAIGGTQSQAEEGAVTATGGGTMTWAALRAEGPAPEQPGRFFLRPVLFPRRRGSLRATGGGTLTWAARAEWDDDDLVLELTA